MSQRTTKTARTAEAAVDRLEKLYAEATSGLERRARPLPERRRAAVRGGARHVPLPAAARHPSRPRSAAADPPARLRPPAAARRVRDDRHAPARLPPLPARAAQSAADGVRREDRGGGERPGDPLSVCAGARRRDHRRQRHRRRPGAAFPDAAAVDGGRRDRRRPVGAARGRAAAAVAVRCGARRLLAAPAGALHGQRLAQRAAVDPAHQLPPLRRPVHPLGPRPAGGRTAPSRKLVLPGGSRIERGDTPEQADAVVASYQWHRFQMPAYHLVGAGRRGRDAGQHRRRPVQRQEHHRPPGGAAAELLADGRPLRRPARHAAHRRLRAGTRLPAPGPHSRRAGAAGYADPGAGRDPDRPAGRGGASSPAPRARR